MVMVSLSGIFLYKEFSQENNTVNREARANRGNVEDVSVCPSPPL